MAQTTSVPLHSANGSAKQKNKTAKLLPTGRMAFATQTQVLRAYSAACGSSAKAVTNAEIGRLTDLKPETVALAHPFFVSIGLLERTESGMVPCEEVVSLTLAYEWNPESGGHRLAPIFQGAWFAEALLPRLQLGPRTENDVIADLAEAAGVGKEAKAQLRTLLDFLELSGLIRREDGMVRANRPCNDGQGNSKTTNAAESAPVVRDTQSTVVTGFSRTAGNKIQMSFSIEVDTTDIMNWEPSRITAFMAGVAQILAAKGALEKREGTPNETAR